MFKFFLIACIAGVLSASSLSNPQYEIHAGNCSKAVASDLVLQKHIHLTRVPFMTREDSVSYSLAYVKLYYCLLYCHKIKYFHYCNNFN